MSRYSERHQHVPDCAYTDCPNDGKHLAIVNGHPWWLCDHHDEQHKKEAS